MRRLNVIGNAAISIVVIFVLIFLYICILFFQTTKNSNTEIKQQDEIFLPQKNKNPESQKTKKIKQASEKKQNQEVDPLISFFPENELKIIRKKAIENHCTGDLFYILLAIRRSESGRKGLEFGVMHPKAKNTNLETQAGWAAATVAKNYERWHRNDCPDNFITFLGNRYCPVGANNDPQGLNRHWIKNVTYWYNKLKEANEK